MAATERTSGRAGSPREERLLLPPPSVSTTLRAALGDAIPDAAALLRLCETARMRADTGARRVVRDIERIALAWLEEDGAVQAGSATALLVACRRFHEAIGEVGRSAQLAATLLEHCARLKDERLEGQALLGMATACLARDDSRGACLHLERLNVHAARAPHPGLKLAAMGTAVVVLERMGLPHDARALALKLLDYPVRSHEGRLAHVRNAINGIRISHQIDHVDAASLFDELLSEWAADGARDLPPDVRARAAIARAAHQTAQGKPHLAARRLGQAIERCGEPAHLGVRVMLVCARATAFVAAADVDGIEDSVATVATLLSQSGDMPVEHEELLRTAIVLQLACRTDGSRARAMDGLDALRAHRAAHDGLALPLLRRPMTFESPIVGTRDGDGTDETARAEAMWLYEGVDGMCLSFDREGISLFSESDFELDRFFASAVKPSEMEIEAPLRTPQYRIAENWAVAVELAAGGNGLQCFKVGRIAAALSAALGFTQDRCVVVELASRLRDVGRATARSPDAAPGRNRVRDEHRSEEARAGDRILSFAGDATVGVAARIARQRHRWWNGGGPTRGAGGEAIAIEARICAVADTFVALVDPVEGGRAWSVEKALAQVESMAGLQLDPTLVGLLGRALRFNEPVPIAAVPWGDSVVEAGRLAEAHRRLVKTLELTV